MPRRNKRPALPTPEVTLADVSTPERPFIPRPQSLLTPRERMNPAHRDRVDREAARAALTKCAMPLCDNSPVLDHDGHNLGICRGCLFTISVYLDRLDEEAEPVTEARIKREQRREYDERVAEREYERRRLTPGWIYYLRVDERIKIGYSTDVKRRMRAYPPHARLLVVHPGTKQLERELHAQFATLLAAGREWFHPRPELEAHIKDALTQFGEPEQRHIYRYRDASQQTMRLHRRSNKRARI